MNHYARDYKGKKVMEFIEKEKAFVAREEEELWSSDDKEEGNTMKMRKLYLIAKNPKVEGLAVDIWESDSEKDETMPTEKKYCFMGRYAL
ncbi:hypothetical protein L1887_15076 [Cichorium endivia]|nr:hypothetical protein L1887_15076 [Cichorium endivia]